MHNRDWNAVKGKANMTNRIGQDVLGLVVAVFTFWHFRSITSSEEGLIGNQWNAPGDGEEGARYYVGRIFAQVHKGLFILQVAFFSGVAPPCLGETFALLGLVPNNMELKWNQVPQVRSSAHFKGEPTNQRVIEMYLDDDQKLFKAGVNQIYQ